MRAPLERAATRGNRELARKLAGAGAEVGNARHQAFRGGHREIVSDLLEEGGTGRDTDRATPPHIVAQEGETEMCCKCCCSKGS